MIVPTSHTAHQVIICQTIMTATKMQLVDTTHSQMLGKFEYTLPAKF